ncbi:hypothetical protein DH2020_045584 [Rehmannia glutinosa]|uniref:HMA domain-containing protein n=1 Tax=Rehmannia glutinosa TaxID=99300 RepID=A0ABR0UEF7_REHGL
MTGDKCRSKAMKIAVAISGVESVALTGQEKNEVEVVGYGIDSVKLTRRLRKNVAHAELVSVGEAKREQSKPDSPPPVVGFLAPPYYGFPNYHYCEVREPICDGPCTIM